MLTNLSNAFLYKKCVILYHLLIINSNIHNRLNKQFILLAKSKRN